MPTAIVAIFSKLKYITASNFEGFRRHWNAKYFGGFVVHSKAFDGLEREFPIGFLIWKTNQLARRQLLRINPHQDKTGAIRIWYLPCNTRQPSSHLPVPRRTAADGRA